MEASNCLAVNSSRFQLFPYTSPAPLHGFRACKGQKKGYSHKNEIRWSFILDFCLVSGSIAVGSHCPFAYVVGVAARIGTYVHTRRLRRDKNRQ
jgi:hypothetical protein